jgi:hypothetical protein
MSKFITTVIFAAATGLVASVAQAQQGQTATGGIYTCVDSKGRKLTSDRPIADCVDREQRVLNPSGTVKATVGPTLTAHEQTELEARQRKEAEEKARLAEEKRRERALLVRYPNKDVHDAERAEALAQINVVKQAAANRVVELQKEKNALMGEMEFYKRDPTKAPPSLTRQVDENAHSLEVQARFIADQDSELRRVSARFDYELDRLKPLWAQMAPLTPPTAKR